MDNFKQENIEHTKEPIIDRGIPSVAINPKGQLVFMVIFLGVAVIAIILVVIAGFKKEAPKSIINPQETVFKGSVNGTPYIQADPLLPPPLPKTELEPVKEVSVTDPMLAQKELMFQQEALRMAAEQKKRADIRLKSPQVIYDDGGHADGDQIERYDASGNATGGIIGETSSNDANLSFAQSQSNLDVDTSHATKLAHPEMLIAQGTMIAGILETAIQSDLPGMLRAIISEDIYGFDGSKLLIPRGSRLIGRYKSGLVNGQVRVFVMWNRILRADGISINLGSYGTDDLGRSGLDGDLDTHFMEKFGSSILLSMIDTGLQIGAKSIDNQNSATVAIESGKDVSSAAELALENSIGIPPTINIDQGKRIKVFVSKDLDFASIDTKR